MHRARSAATMMGEDLRSVLRALAPYLPDVVIIGGWVPELHRRFGVATWRTIPSRTTELDVLVRPVLDPKGRPKLREPLERARIHPARPVTFPADWVAQDTDTTVLEFLMARPARVDPTPGADKRAKDLLYLRDLIHAGPEVLPQLARDTERAFGGKRRRASRRSGWPHVRGRAG
jgi:hypothetical protein